MPGNIGNFVEKTGCKACEENDDRADGGDEWDFGADAASV